MSRLFSSLFRLGFKSGVVRRSAATSALAFQIWLAASSIGLAQTPVSPPSSDLTLLAWGNGGLGQIGDGNSSQAPSPKIVISSHALAGKLISSIAVGGGCSAAVASDGSAYMWGQNSFGQLGNGTTVNANEPAAVAMIGVLAGKQITSVALNGNYTLALTSDGKVFAWGQNDRGQLGNGTTTDSSVPVAVTGALSGKQVVAIAAGGGNFSLALTSDGLVYAWGWNLAGQLGNGTTTESHTPIAVTTTGVLSGKTITAISAGYDHVLALSSSGQVFAWGDGAYGQLGNQGASNTGLPVAVYTGGLLSGKTVTSIAAGFFHSLVLTSDHQVLAWGYNSQGELGNNTTVLSREAVSVRTSGVLSGKTITKISAGPNHNLAVSADGVAFAWGYDFYGELGDATNTTSLVPVAVARTGQLANSVFSVVAASQGAEHCLALATVPAAVTTVVGPTAGPYYVGDVLTFTVTFTRPVTISGFPQLYFNIGGSLFPADYLAGSGTNVLTFRGTLTSGLPNSNGIDAYALNLNGGSMIDSTGLPAAFASTSIHLSGVIVRAGNPPGYQPPIARAGGAYRLAARGSMILDGTSSYDPDTGDAIVSYEWDIDGDGVYGDVTGPSPFILASAYGLAPGDHAIGLKVTDSHGHSSIDTTTLTITSDPSLTAFDVFRRLASDGSGASDLKRGSDGKLYGLTTMTLSGQIKRSLFSINDDGTGYRVIHVFQSLGDDLPVSLLVGDDGFLYCGGNNSVFRVNLFGGDFTTLCTLDDTTVGNSVVALVKNSSGRLFGVTSGDGPNGAGAIFSLLADGSDFQLLHAISDAGVATLLVGLDGKLYGTNTAGGMNNKGVLFSMKTDGTNYAEIHAMDPALEGASPVSALVQSSAGRLYGSTVRGSAGNGAGTLFALDPDGSNFAVLRVIDAGTEGNEAGFAFQGADGKLYGTAQQNGSGGGGSVFALNADGSGFTVLHALNVQTEGSIPLGLLQTNAGALAFVAGSIGYESAHPFGAIFTLNTNGSGLTLLRNFTATQFGTNPGAGLVQGPDGRLYGTTMSGGAEDSGTIFAINTDGSGLVQLHQMIGYFTEGKTPAGALVLGPDGRFYGVTQFGGVHNAGTIFAITPSGAFSLVCSLSGGPGGARPISGLMVGLDGKLYGTAAEGGASGDGVIFSVTTAGVYTPLYSPNNTARQEGSFLQAGLVQGAGGRLYGAAASGGANGGGTIFSLNSSGTGYTVLHALSDATDGSAPISSLMIGSNGRLYGVNQLYGGGGYGTLFALSPNGVGFTVLHVFDGAAGDYVPSSGLMQWTDGRLFGMAGAAALYSIAPDGSGYRILSSNEAVIGNTSLSTLIRGNDGWLYGTTSAGGPNPISYGTIFACDPGPNLAGQTIDFDAISDQAVGAAPFAISATASSGLPVTLTLVSGPATLNGTTVTLTGIGAVMIRATQPGNGSYFAATSVTRQFYVLPLAPSYTVTDLGTLGGTNSTAAAINSSGQVVGEAFVAGNTSRHAVKFSGIGTGNTDLGTLNGTDNTSGAAQSSATAINTSGFVVGYGVSAAGSFHAIRFGVNPAANADLGTLGGALSIAWAVSETGQAAGTARTGGGGGGIDEAVLFGAPPGANLDLGTLGGVGSIVYAIGSSGQMVGYAQTSSSWVHATRFSGTGSGNFDLGTLGGDYSEAHAINASGQAVGYGTTLSGDVHAILFSGIGSGNTDLGTLGGANSYALGINASGVIVGTAHYTDQNRGHGFVRQPNDSMVDLNVLIDRTTGWEILGAVGIDDSGRIAVNAERPGGSHALLLTPVVTRQSQTITFLSLGNKIYGFDPFTVTANASSGLPVTFSVVSGPATISGNLVTLTSSGAVTIRASQMGDGTYAPAPDVDQTFNVAAPPARGPAHYTIADLGTPGGLDSFAVAINASGVIAGTTFNGSASHAIRWSGTDTTNLDLSALATFGAQATAINDSGQIAGASYVLSGNQTPAHAVRYSGTGSGNFDLGTLGGSTSDVAAINAGGIMVGGAALAGDVTYHAVRYSGTGTGNFDLGSLDGNSSYAAGINSAGVIVGYSSSATGVIRAVRFSGTGANNFDLGALGGALSDATAINASGQIVGEAQLSNGDVHATLFSGTGSGNTDLGTLGDQSTATAINASGQIVGVSRISGTLPNAFIYFGGTMTNLNSVIGLAPGWVLTDARGINDAGQIAADGVDHSGHTHALRLTPIALPPAAQTIAFAALPNKTLGDAPFTVSATASSGLPVTFSVTSGPATISGSTVTLTGSGLVTITASQAGNGSFSAAPPVSQSFLVAPDPTARVVINFSAVTDRVYGDQPFYVGGSTPTFQGVVITVLSGPAVVGPEFNGSYLITLTGVGPVTLRASLQGDPTHALADPVDRTFNVAKTVINFLAVIDRIYGDAPFSVGATTSTSLNVMFSVLSGPATVTPTSTISGVVTLTGVGPVTLRASLPGDPTYALADPVDRTFNVAKTVINFPAVTDRVYGDAPFSVGATTSTSLNVVFSVLSGPATVTPTSTISGVVTLTGVGPVTLRASVPGDPTHALADPVERTFNIFGRSYASWAASRGLTAANNAPTADPDGDGVPNQLEYILGLNPLVPDSNGLPTGTSESGQFVFRFVHDETSGAAFAVQQSSDLLAWTSLATTVESSTVNTETLIATLPFTATKQFVRLTSGGVSTVPVGFLKTTLPNGATTAFGLPLDDTSATPIGLRAAKIQSFTASTITHSTGGWTGNLANPAAPWALRITSGPAAGKLLDITANTATTLTVSGADLTTLGLGAGTDSFELIPMDTLGTLFSGALLGGTSAATADNVQVRSGTSWLVYFYDTNLGFWRRTIGPATNSNNVIIRPATGVQILRRGSTATLTFLGRVLGTTFRTPINNASSTVIHPGFPMNTTLGSLAVQTLLSGWTAADTVSLFDGTTWVSYAFNGANWQPAAGGANSDATAIAAGALITIQRPGASTGTTDFIRVLPYSP